MVASFVGSPMIRVVLFLFVFVVAGCGGDEDGRSGVPVDDSPPYPTEQVGG